jgi:hypothetical protein
MDQSFLKKMSRGVDAVYNVPLNGNGGPVKEFVPFNPRRVALVIGSPAAGGLIIYDGITDAPGTGVQMTAGVPPLVLSLLLHGPIVQGPIFATSLGAGAVTHSYWESVVDGD